MGVLQPQIWHFWTKMFLQEEKFPDSPKFWRDCPPPLRPVTTPLGGTVVMFEVDYRCAALTTTPHILYHIYAILYPCSFIIIIIIIIRSISIIINRSTASRLNWTYLIDLIRLKPVGHCVRGVSHWSWRHSVEGRMMMTMRSWRTTSTCGLSYSSSCYASPAAAVTTTAEQTAVADLAWRW